MRVLAYSEIGFAVFGITHQGGCHEREDDSGRKGRRHLHHRTDRGSCGGGETVEHASDRRGRYSRRRRTACRHFVGTRHCARGIGTRRRRADTAGRAGDDAQCHDLRRGRFHRRHHGTDDGGKIPSHAGAEGWQACRPDFDRRRGQAARRGDRARRRRACANISRPRDATFRLCCRRRWRRKAATARRWLR